VENRQFVFILLSVLEHRFADRGTAVHWFPSHLTERTQSFVFALKQTTMHGVLGRPILFSVLSRKVLY